MNADEICYQNFADAITHEVIVHLEVNGDSMQVPVERRSKRATLLGAIAADSIALTPMLILHRETSNEKYYNCATLRKGDYGTPRTRLHFSSIVFGIFSACSCSIL
jgi:hypothetical protein